MDETRFYYSTDGSDAQGPVTKDVLRQLFRDQVIGPASYLCREGETEWQLLDPLDYQMQPPPPPMEKKVVTVLKIAESPIVQQEQPLAPPAAYAPRDNALQMALKIVLYMIYGGIAFAGAIGGAFLQTSLSGNHNAAQRSGELVGAFTCYLLLTAGAPYFLSRTVSGMLRPLICTVGAFILSLVAIGIHLSDVIDSSRIKADLATVNSDMDKLSNATLSAQSSMVDLSPGTIKTLDDIASRRSAVTKLHDTRQELLTYLQNFDAHYRELMVKDKLSPKKIDDAISSARSEIHIDELVALYSSAVKLSEDELASLNFLEKDWGHWSTKDGKLLFEDDATLTAYNAIVHTIQKDLKDVADARKKFTALPRSSA